ncbi:MAG: hypothetical protein M3Z59_05375, partial [Bombella apis]|nr:hypothetical protein [Bombella apis]
SSKAGYIIEETGAYGHIINSFIGGLPKRTYLSVAILSEAKVGLSTNSPSFLCVLMLDTASYQTIQEE